jgi:hypothetical protein
MNKQTLTTATASTDRELSELTYLESKKQTEHLKKISLHTNIVATLLCIATGCTIIYAIYLSSLTR